METIQFTYANFRYLMFERGGQYYLLDRSPRHFIGYLFPPLNWFFYQKVYPITEEDYLRIKQRNNQFKHIVIPVSLGAGLSVFIGAWSRTVNLSFKTDFSEITNIILLSLALLLSYILAQLVYRSREKSILFFVHSSIDHPIYYKIRPIKVDYKRLIGYFILMLGIPFFSAWFYLYLKDLLFLLATFVMVFLALLCVNIAFSAEEGDVYKIVDIKANKEH